MQEFVPQMRESLTRPSLISMYNSSSSDDALFDLLILKMKEPPPYLEEQVVEMKYLIQPLWAGPGVVLAEIDSKGWSGVMAAKEENVATMKGEIVSKHRKV